jgi:hypothetical protein
MPRLPYAAEHEVMNDLVTTYGKTFHLWQVDKGDQLPLGIPQLMMAFTDDGQWHEDLRLRRDRRQGVDTAYLRKSRADIPAPMDHPNADSWKSGTTYQLKLESRPFKRELKKIYESMRP